MPRASFWPLQQSPGSSSATVAQNMASTTCSTSALATKLVSSRHIRKPDALTPTRHALFTRTPTTVILTAAPAIDPLNPTDRTMILTGASMKEARNVATTAGAITKRHLPTSESHILRGAILKATTAATKPGTTSSLAATSPRFKMLGPRTDKESMAHTVVSTAASMVSSSPTVETIAMETASGDRFRPTVSLNHLKEDSAPSAAEARMVAFLLQASP